MKPAETYSDRSMRSNKSIRTMKSMKSFDTKSQKALRSRRMFTNSGLLENQVPAIEVSLPSACKKYRCPFNVYVKKEYQPGT